LRNRCAKLSAGILRIGRRACWGFSGNMNGAVLRSTVIAGRVILGSTDNAFKQSARQAKADRRSKTRHLRFGKHPESMRTSVYYRELERNRTGGQIQQELRRPLATRPTVFGSIEEALHGTSCAPPAAPARGGVTQSAGRNRLTAGGCRCDLVLVEWRKVCGFQ
jgi:hypothetical protein